MFALAHPLALVASYIFLRLRGHDEPAHDARSPKRGPIALPPDEQVGPQGGPAAARSTGAGEGRSEGEREAREVDAEAREVDAEAVWG